MYHFINKLHSLYGLLNDEQSKDIFQARFAIDMEPSAPHIERLISAGGCKLGRTQSQKEQLKELDRKHKKIVLYGTAQTGQSLAKMLEINHISFYGFCGRGYKKFPGGLFGKPVLSPDELIAHKDEYYVVLAVILKKSYSEILEFLHGHDYPENQILDWVDKEFVIDNKQYFEFPDLYRRNTVFIDGGCYDCESSYRFAEWCGGKYSSIIAFEPDPVNYAKCSEKMQNVPLPNFQLVNAGLSDQKGRVDFNAKNTGGSRIIPTRFDSLQTIINKISIQTVAIDDIVDDLTVGFIKMDIEGAEFDALRGAKKTILRDKPLLAICVYHLRGDLFAIMDYLHQLLPEYRFLLRHYGATENETVLYASIDL